MRSEIEIDEVDATILKRLTENARESLVEIARDCGLTSSAILNRINRLREIGVILGTQIFIDGKKFGYPYQATVLIDASNSLKREIKQAIREMLNVIVCAESIGRFNLCALVIAKDITELNSVTSLIKRINGVNKVATNIWIDSINSPMVANFKATRANKDQPIDNQILTELMADAQIPFSRIAKKIGVSHETVRKRYEKMKKDGTIKQCSIIIDGHKIGHQGTAFLLLTSTQAAKKPETMANLARIKSLSLVTEVMGDFDFFAYAQVKNLQQLAELVDEITEYRDIDRLEVLLLTHTYFSFAPVPEFPIKCDSVDLSSKS